ncbi:hypothetical protein E1285_39900 [Actinomadura sp. 7K507]|nr:hypothetical protein E1285_39900 [Actinomadura sp. 7K507]
MRPGSRGAPREPEAAPDVRGRDPGPGAPAPRPGTPPLRLDSPGRARRTADGEQPRPAAAETPEPAPPPSDVPAIWGKPGRRPEPPKARPEQPAAGPPQVRRGQSIAAYKRPELVEIVGRIAAREPDLSDDQLVDLVTRLLECPEDEALLVGARLRYAVDMYRGQTGGGSTES